MNYKSTALCVIGGVAMLVGFVMALINYFNTPYSVIQNIPVELSNAPVVVLANNVSIKEASNISAWLKVPGRGIENSGLTVNFIFLKDDKESIGVINHEFGFWSTRSGSPQGQIYKLGSLNVQSEFKGDIKIMIGGEWKPPYNGTIILRENKVDVIEMVLPYLAVLAIGAVLLSLGIAHFETRRPN